MLMKGNEKYFCHRVDRGFFEADVLKATVHKAVSAWPEDSRGSIIEIFASTL
jgi:hypothetical protein